MAVCQDCGLSNVGQDSTTSICLNCGRVLEDNNLVSEVTFGERSSGAAYQHGQFVDTSAFAVSASGSATDSEEFKKRLRILEKIGYALKLKQQQMSVAENLFRLAVSRGFTKGRRTKVVAAACLYTATRRANLDYLLIDFADVIEEPVKKIGKVFTTLTDELSIDVPNIDPSLFCERYAHKLNVGSDAHKVAVGASRLIKAMNRDWIATGRRPQGLSGAALLIAARFYGHQVSAETVAALVRMSGSTIQKRLSEWKVTPIARLTRDEFEKLGAQIEDLPVRTVPPAFLRNCLQKEKAAANALKDAEARRQIKDRASPAAEGQAALEDAPPGARADPLEPPLPPAHLQPSGGGAVSSSSSSSAAAAASSSSVQPRGHGGFSLSPEQLQVASSEAPSGSQLESLAKAIIAAGAAATSPKKKRVEGLGEGEGGGGRPGGMGEGEGVDEEEARELLLSLMSAAEAEDDDDDERDEGEEWGVDEEGEGEEKDNREEEEREIEEGKIMQKTQNSEADEETAQREEREGGKGKEKEKDSAKALMGIVARAHSHQAEHPPSSSSSSEAFAPPGASTVDFHVQMNRGGEGEAGKRAEEEEEEDRGSDAAALLDALGAADDAADENMRALALHLADHREGEAAGGDVGWGHLDVREGGGEGDGGWMDDDSLSEIDDEELKGYVLPAAARQLKERMWRELTKGWLRDFEHACAERRERRRREEERERAGAGGEGEDGGGRAGAGAERKRPRRRDFGADDPATAAQRALEGRGRPLQDELCAPDELEALFHLGGMGGGQEVHSGVSGNMEDVGGGDD
uniref:B-related factor 1 n=1 Tax=Chromera velia CCMP2878 TaxID=1169474 RepID=A0A0G4IFH7_9ALVE|eukprot:Cvel_14044.t1-p1 / transcript=Cvel_14044.t1 / gene=Cvel_14044 / organism=Chromera_velia_CCMP2878 / gene_product=Transcription factor IIIB 90 kDa subunit, putative / transcript_product=Transcription factor IIIB 90 kDa subunit, putative / location=Cvel_scaffold984:38243-41887(+) / protein_length=804 / sequence_SO=supercontig / SO=protein_coding / is_pseudo=false